MRKLNIKLSTIILMTLLNPLAARGDETEAYLMSGQRLYDEYLAYQAMRIGGECGSLEPCLKRRDEASSYISTVVASANMLALMKHKFSLKFFCAPGSVSYGQYADIVGKYLEAHPELRHKFQSELILEALANTFPCIGK